MVFVYLEKTLLMSLSVRVFLFRASVTEAPLTTNPLNIMTIIFFFIIKPNEMKVNLSYINVYLQRFFISFGFLIMIW